jgi:hypothetical protein
MVGMGKNVLVEKTRPVYRGFPVNIFKGYILTIIITEPI